MFTYGSEDRALNRSERRKIETSEMRVSGHTDHVRNTTVRVSLEEVIHDCSHILRKSSSRLNQTLIITAQKDKEIFDDGRIDSL
jgi:hypothetical protein